MTKHSLETTNVENPKNIFAKSFWWTIIALFMITLVMLALSIINSSDQLLQTEANKRAYEALSDEVIAAMPKYVGEVMEKVSNDPFPQTEQTINDSVDEHFLKFIKTFQFMLMPIIQF